MASKLKVGDMIQLKLDNLAHGGETVGRYEGVVVFVAGGIPGEEVRVKVLEKKRNFLRAQLIEVLKPVQERVLPPCPVYQDCGGCQLQEMNYSAQLEHKRRMLADLLQRVGGIADLELEPLLGADYPWGYRNKAQFPLALNKKGEIITGFYQEGSHQVVAHGDCLIQHPLLNRIKNKALALFNEYQLSVYDEKRHQGLLRHLVVRAGICTNQALLIIVTREEKLPYAKEIAGKLMAEIPELLGVLQNVNPARTNVVLGPRTKTLAGQAYYYDYIGDIKFAISSHSFFQVNTLQTKKLYDLIREYAGLTGQERVLDAYCGLGSIALYLAREAAEVQGIEEVAEAIVAARKNARLNQLSNCQFEVGKVEEKLPAMMAAGYVPDLIIFDPPRKGLAREVLDSILKTLPPKIIYVSCNPATLARDLKVLQEKYKISKVQGVDMFPQTYHVETVVLIKRKHS